MPDGPRGERFGGNPSVNGGGKSDRPVLPAKPPNKPALAGAEVAEGRGLPEGNTASETRAGHSAGMGVSSELDRVRQAARKDRDARFTALLHHVGVDRLREAYRAISSNAAAGVDGVTWRDYGMDLEDNLGDLHDRVQRGAYRASPVRRALIPKPDGRLRPLGVATLGDKIVQRAVVEVLNAIYERLPRLLVRVPAWARSARCVGRARGRDRTQEGELRARRGHSRLLHPARSGWLETFLEHRIADKRVLRLIQKWLRVRGHRDRGMFGDDGGYGAGGIGLTAARQGLPALRVRPVGRPVAAAARARGRDPDAVRRRLRGGLPAP